MIRLKSLECVGGRLALPFQLRKCFRIHTLVIPQK